MMSNMIENPLHLKQRLMKSDLNLGRIKSKQKQFSISQSVQFKIFDAIKIKIVRDKFGGKLRHGFYASAACPKEVLQCMDNIGIKIYGGYGLTETSPKHLLIAHSVAELDLLGSLFLELPFQLVTSIVNNCL